MFRVSTRAAALRDHPDRSAWLDAYQSRAVGPSPGTGAYDPDAWRALADARLVIVGGGAVGGTTLTALVRQGAGTGNGHITVYDPDVAEVSNLQRQPLTDAHAQARVPKVQGLVEWVDTHVPYAAVTGIAHAVTPTDVPDALLGADAVVMAADVSVPEVNLSVLHHCVENRIPVFGGLDLNRTSVSWNWTPTCHRSPLNRGRFRYGPDGPTHRLETHEITVDDLPAVVAGTKLHAFAWLIQMIDPADLPQTLLRGLLEVVGSQAFLPQARVAAARQAQQTADFITAYLDNPVGRWPDAWTYAVFDAEMHPSLHGLSRGLQWGDDSLVEASRSAVLHHRQARAHFVDQVFRDQTNPAAATLLTLLGVSVDTLRDGRCPLADETGR